MRKPDRPKSGVIFRCPTVMVASGSSAAQKHAYVLADNKLALNGGWDNDLLKIELGDLQALAFDLDLISAEGIRHDDRKL